MVDILKEQKNLAPITSKRTYVHRANRTPKDPIRQSKSPKRIKNSKPSNRCKKPDKGSSYNIHPEEDEEVFKDVEIELKSDLDLELESFIYVIRNFDLDDNKSNCSISSLSFRNNAEDSETEGSYLVAFNRSKKPLKRSPNRCHDPCRDIRASATNLRLMVECRENDNGTNRKNSCDRSYRNYRTDHTGAALIGQHISI